MWMTAPQVNGRMKTILYDGLGIFRCSYGSGKWNKKRWRIFLKQKEFYEYCNYMHKWFENGWVSQSAATDTESYYSYIKSGQALSFSQFQPSAFFD